MLFRLFFSTVILVALSGVISADGYIPSKKCAKCHREIYNEHKLSRHARAWSSDFFHSKVKETGENCLVGCHAPVAVVDQDHMVIVSQPRTKYKHEGVGCYSCHANAHTQKPTMHGPFKNTRSDYHQTRYDAKFKHTNACIPCHQYLDVYDQYNSLLKGGAKDKRCQDCHMPVVKRAIAVDSSIRTGASHRFRGAYDKDLVRESVKTGFRLDDGQLKLRVENTGGGHQIPGGIWRTLILKVEQYDKNEKITATRLIEINIENKNTLLHGKPVVYDFTVHKNSIKAAALIMLRMRPGDSEKYWQKIERKFIKID